MIVTISGPMHVGKTTLAKGLVYEYEHSYRRPMATQLRDLLTNYRIPETRENLQRVGHGLRECDPDVWVKAWVRTSSFLALDNLVIIDDARYQNEIDLGDINVFLDLTDVTEQWDRFRTSDKFSPATLYGAWDKARQHSTERQQLVPVNDKAIVLDTTNLSPRETLAEVLARISPLIRQPKREEVMELPW